MDKKHLKCLLWKVFWGISALSLFAALVSVLTKTLVFQFDPLFWFWSALIFGILSIPIKLDCHSCAVCGISQNQA